MAYIFKAGDGRTTSIYAYNSLTFLSRNLFLNYFTCCKRTHVVYLRLPGVVFIVGTDSFKSREKVTGAPQLLVVGSIDQFLPVRMCRFTAVRGSTGTIITKPTLIQQVNLTSLTLMAILFCENLATRKLKPTVSGI